jgi:hypothetical protein
MFLTKAAMSRSDRTSPAAAAPMVDVKLNVVSIRVRAKNRKQDLELLANKTGLQPDYKATEHAPWLYCFECGSTLLLLWMHRICVSVLTVDFNSRTRQKFVYVIL